MAVPRFRLVPDPAAESALVTAFRANALVTGPAIGQFERRLATLSGHAHCVTSVNGYCALLLALDALGVRGRPVIMPALSTCFAPLNAVLAAGARPVFVDVDADARIDVAAVRDALPRLGAERPVVLAPAHFGAPVDAAGLLALGCVVLEDDAQAAHTVLATRPAATLRALSFYPSKHLPAIDGGAVLTNDDELARRMRDRRYYSQQTEPDGVLRYNARLPALHAAVGLASLDGAGVTAARLRLLATQYRDALGRYGSVRVLAQAGDMVPSRCVIALPDAALAAGVLAGLQARGIGASRELLALASSSALAQHHPVARDLLERTLSLPFYPDLGVAELREVAAALGDVLAGADR